MTSPPPPQLPTDPQPLQLIVYPSPLFAAHWALFLPSASDPKLGTRIHADGSPAIGFEVLIEEDYDLKECTQSWNVFELGTVDVGGLMGAVRSVEAPGKSLRAVGDEKDGEVSRAVGKRGQEGCWLMRAYRGRDARSS
jgi:hypothetical protein